MIVGQRKMARPKGEFGNWLSERLDAYNMTQTELANMLDVSLGTVSDHMVHRGKPRLVYLIGYSVILNADLNDLKAMVERDWA